MAAVTLKGSHMGYTVREIGTVVLLVAVLGCVYPIAGFYGGIVGSQIDNVEEGTNPLSFDEDSGWSSATIFGSSRCRNERSSVS